MYYLVENWQRTEMDVLYFGFGAVPNDQKWRVMGIYRKSADAWGAYRRILDRATDEMSLISSLVD